MMLGLEYLQDTEADEQETREDWGNALTSWSVCQT